VQFICERRESHKRSRTKGVDVYNYGGQTELLCTEITDIIRSLENLDGFRALEITGLKTQSPRDIYPDQVDNVMKMMKDEIDRLWAGRGYYPNVSFSRRQSLWLHGTGEVDSPFRLSIEAEKDEVRFHSRIHDFSLTVSQEPSYPSR
jgi:hypothetical protein